MKLYYDSNGDGTENQLISNIISYPNIIQRLDNIGVCSFTIIDRLGALYTTWEPLDNIKFKIEDDNSNVLFRGYVDDKVFKNNILHITARGIGIKLEWKSFNKNYFHEEGKISEVTSTSTTSLYNFPVVQADANVNANWAVNGWAELSTVGGNQIYADHNNGGDIQTYSFAATDGDCEGGITEAYLTLYGKTETAGSITGTVSVSFDNGASWEDEQNLTFSVGSYEYKYITFDGLNEADWDDFQVRFTAPAVLEVWETFHVDYMTVRFTGLSYITTIELTDNDDAVFSWNDDEWINDREVGFLVTDNTNGFTTPSWDCSAVAVDHSFWTLGDETGVQNLNDASTYVVKDTYAEGEMIITATIDDTGPSDIPDTNTINNIEIHYKLAHWHNTGTDEGMQSRLNFQIYNGTSWSNIIPSSLHYDRGESVKWMEGTVTLTNESDLSLYLKDTTADNDWDTMEGIRVSLTPLKNAGSYYGISIDYINIEINYNEATISPIMLEITDNDDTSVSCSDIIWSGSGVQVGDTFKIGENTTTIIHEISLVSGLEFDLQTTLQFYAARWFRGIYCMDAFRTIIELEGVHWWEDYENDRIIISHEDDFADSTVDLTNTNYLYEWKIHDEPNEISKVHVFGSAAQRVSHIATSSTSTSEKERIYVDDNIMTNADAEKVADSLLSELENKRPQIEIPLQGVNYNLQVGTTVTLTMTNPTIAETQYPINKIERKKGSYSGTDDIWTTIYCGLGSTTPFEKMTDRINQNNYQSRKNTSNRLIGTPLSTVSGIVTWSDIGGKPSTFTATQASVESHSINNVVEDTTPQLGGNLDLNSKELSSAAALPLKVSGDNDDYYEFNTVSNNPHVKRVGGDSFIFESDDASYIQLYIKDTFSNFMSILYDKTNHFTTFRSDGLISIQVSGDYDDYLYFSTASNIAYLLPVEDKVHYLGSASLSYDHVYADDFDNTSPFKKFDDPISELMKIKGKNEDEIDYSSLPEWVRSHERDPTKHVWDEKKEKIKERAPKDVVSEKGWSINRMCIFLYQTIQKQQEKIDRLEELITLIMGVK